MRLRRQIIAEDVSPDIAAAQIRLTAEEIEKDSTAVKQVARISQLELGELGRSMDLVPRGGLTILIAEDDLDTRDCLAMLLRAFGHLPIAEVGTAAETLDAVKLMSPDVVLLDVHLPDGSGVEVAKALRTFAPDVAVVFLTGDSALRINDSDAEATAASALIAKPVRAATLEASLRIAAARAHDGRQARKAADDAALQLEHRKIIDGAKHVLMGRGSTEPGAFRALQRLSQDRSQPMIDIAREILAEASGKTD
jgi:two-component system, response regulator PdtaR